MVSFCAAVSSLCTYSGGITRAGSLAKIRSMMALCSGLPGTIGIAPELSAFIASLRISRRIPAMRLRLSGPWQRKHVSDMIGRMSRLKPTFASSASAQAIVRTRPAIRAREAFKNLISVPEVHLHPNPQADYERFRNPNTSAERKQHSHTHSDWRLRIADCHDRTFP